MATDAPTQRSWKTEVAPDEAPGLTTPRAAGVAGILFAVLFSAAILTTRMFVSLTSTGLAQELTGSLRLAGSAVAIYLVPFSGIAFLWFVGVVRDRIGALEDRFFATVFLGSAMVFVAMLFGAGAAIAALLTLTHVTPDSAELGRAIARAMLYVYGARSAGVFMLVTSTIVLRTRSVPRWVAFIGYAVGLVSLLTVGSFDLVVLLFPAWVTLLSVFILVRARERGGAGARIS